MSELVEHLDHIDQKIENFKHDVEGGVHDAIFDDASLLHVRDDPDQEKHWEDYVDEYGWG